MNLTYVLQSSLVNMNTYRNRKRNRSLGIPVNQTSCHEGSCSHGSESITLLSLSHYVIALRPPSALSVSQTLTFADCKNSEEKVSTICYLPPTKPLIINKFILAYLRISHTRLTHSSLNGLFSPRLLQPTVFPQRLCSKIKAYRQSPSTKPEIHLQSNSRHVKKSIKIGPTHSYLSVGGSPFSQEFV